MKRLLQTYIFILLLLVTAETLAQNKIRIRVREKGYISEGNGVRENLIGNISRRRNLDTWYKYLIFNDHWSDLYDAFGSVNDRRSPIFADPDCLTAVAGATVNTGRILHEWDFDRREFTIIGATQRRFYGTDNSRGWFPPYIWCPPFYVEDFPTDRFGNPVTPTPFNAVIPSGDLDDFVWNSDRIQVTIDNTFAANHEKTVTTEIVTWINQKFTAPGSNHGETYLIKLTTGITIIVPQLNPQILDEGNTEVDRFCVGDLIRVRFENFPATDKIFTDFQYTPDDGNTWVDISNGSFLAPNTDKIRIRGQVRIGSDANAFTGDWEESGDINIFDPAPILAGVPDPGDLVVDDLSELTYGDPTTAVQLDHATCKGANNGRIILNSIVGNGNYQISFIRSDLTGAALNITGPDVFNPIILPDHAENLASSGYESGLPAGTYRLTIENLDDNQRKCFSEHFIVIKEPATNVSFSASPVAYAPDIDVTCPDGENGRIQVNASGGLPPYRYFLEGSDGTSRSATGQTSAYTFTGLPALEANGDTIVYTAYSLDAPGCRNTIPAPGIKLKSPEQLSANAFPPHDYDGFNIQCNGATDNLEVFTSGGIYPHTINLYNGDELAGTQTISDPLNAFTEFTGLQAGDNYRVTVASHNLSGNPADVCEITITGISLTEPSPLATSVHRQNVICTGTSTGAIGVKATGGIPPYTFKLDDMDPILRETDSTAFMDLAAGTYELTVTDKYNCTSLQTIEIAEPDVMALSVNTENAQCSDEPNGTATVSIEGGIAPFEVIWHVSGGDVAGTNTDVVSEATINTLYPGFYVVQVSDAENCGIAEATFEVGFNEEVVANLTGIPVLCEGQTTMLDAGNPGASYEWTSNNGLVSDQQAIEVGESGIYSVTVTGPLGCTDSDLFEVTVSDILITADILMPTEAYEGDTVIIIDVSYPIPDAISWDWSDKDKVINTNSYGSAEEFLFAEAGTYTLTLSTFVGDCDKFVSRQIFIKERPEESPNGRTAGLGYEKEAFVKNFSVYPNPTNGVFSVDLKFEEPSSATLTLFSLEWGRKIVKKQLSGKDRYSGGFDLPNLSTGTYALILEVNGEQHSKKIFVR